MNPLAQMLRMCGLILLRNMETSFATDRYASTSDRLLTRPHRLTVRTPGFHPGNRGSIPREVTMKKDHLLVVFFHAYENAPQLPSQAP